MTESTHRVIIATIHEKYQDKPFAMWEIVRYANISSSSARRCIDTLVEIRMVNKANRGFESRFYRTTINWPDSPELAYEMYETAKVIGL